MAVLITHTHPSISEHTELTQILARSVFIFRTNTTIETA